MNKPRQKEKNQIKDPTEIVIYDLKALLFWATVGVSLNYGGSYERDVKTIIKSYADSLKFKLPCKVEFRKIKKMYLEADFITKEDCIKADLKKTLKQ